MSQESQCIDLPTRLVGPVLRRVERGRWTAFLVLSRPINVGVQIYTASYRHECSFLATDAVKLSESIYVYFLSCDLSDKPLPLDEIIYYEVFNAVGRESLSNDLAMDGEGLCSFIVKEEANVLFGSCRKIHIDRDDILAKAYEAQESKSADRASLLLMAGDQIYADDLADSVLELIQFWTRRLFTRAECDFKKAIPKAGKRKKHVKSLGLTTDNGSSHLLGFHEYIVMYLLVWSDSLWKLCDWDFSEESKKNRSGISKFCEGLPAVQKLLANTPTLMLIDDHDVTDDWNIHGKWYANVWGEGQAEFARFDSSRALSSAYLAGLIFQMAGNAELDKSELKELSENYVSYLSGKALADYDAMALFHEVRDMKGHSFVYSPTGRDKYLLMDTRTERRFMGDSDVAPELVRTEKIRALFSEAKDAERLFVISPTPIFGFRSAENFQTKMSRSKLKFLSPSILDREAWSHSKDAFVVLLEELEKHQAETIICLGGDVHYAFADSVEFASGRKVLALTASPFKNVTTAYPFSKWILNYLASTDVEKVLYPSVSFQQKMLESADESIILYRPNLVSMNLSKSDYSILELSEEGDLVKNSYLLE